MTDSDIKTAAPPLVSIGLPVYNGANFIREALDSVLLQSFTDFELIISDNASVDATEAICREYASRDSRIRYVRQPENIGGFPNAMYLLENARGTYFMWIAHDDYVAPTTYLESLTEALGQGGDFAFANVRVVAADRTVVLDDFMGEFANANDKLQLCLQAIKVNSYQMYGLFLRDKLLGNIKYLAQCRHLCCFGEGIFVHSMFNELRGTFVDGVYFNFRRHGSNHSSTQKEWRLLRDFIRFTLADLVYWLKNSTLDVRGTCKVVARVCSIHGDYLTSLLRNAIRSSLRAAAARGRG